MRPVVRAAKAKAKAKVAVKSKAKAKAKASETSSSSSSSSSDDESQGLKPKEAGSRKAAAQATKAAVAAKLKVAAKPNAEKKKLGNVRTGIFLASYGSTLWSIVFFKPFIIPSTSLADDFSALAAFHLPAIFSATGSFAAQRES
eukprot:s679_g24.t1